ncbi:hypothetical protein [Desulfocurvus sp. DL9XJH121]
MASKKDLVNWVREALAEHGGHATIVQVAKYIWNRHGDALRSSGDLFYTWQYDMRRAAQELRDSGVCRNAADCPQGVWVLA